MAQRLRLTRCFLHNLRHTSQLRIVIQVGTTLAITVSSKGSRSCRPKQLFTFWKGAQIMFRSFIILMLVGGTVLGIGVLASVGSDKGSSILRVGTYDNRAIAVAYAHSAYNPVRSKMQEHERAKAAGDAKRVEELERWGPKHQRQLHRQGFCRVPVNDLLMHVRDKLPDVARKANVDVIAWHYDYSAAGVDVVDVTEELALLFDPSDKTLQTIEQLRNKKPLDLDVVEQHHEH